MGIRKKLVLIFSCMSVGILLTVSLAGYFFTKNLCIDSIEKEMNAVLDAQVNKIDGWLNTKQKEVEDATGIIQTLGDNGSLSAELLAKYKKMDTNFVDVYLGTVEGKVISGAGWTPPPGFDARTRSWYITAMKEKKPIFTEPYIDADSKELVVSFALPCQTTDGKIAGVVSADILLNTLTENVKKIAMDGQGNAFLVDEKGFILAHKNAEVIGKKLFELENMKDISGIVKDAVFKGQGVKVYHEDGKEMIMVYKQIPSTKWLLCMTVEEAIAYQPLLYLKWLFIGMTICFTLVGIAVTFMAARRITSPIELLTKRVELLAEGDLTVRAAIAGKDEIAKLAACFNKMVDDWQGMVRNISVSTLEMQESSNNLVDIAATLAANTEEMSATVSTVSAAVEQISAGTEQNASSTEEVSHSVDSIDAMANEMSAAAKKAAETSKFVAGEVNEVSLAIAEVSQSINRVAGFTQEVAKSCKRSIFIAAEAQKRSDETNEIIKKLNVSSKQINNIISIIRNIAEQTNMLALNATIEAAGAGEAGKGFAVVAGEVKELSKRTAEEAARIAQQIEDMQHDMTEAVLVVGKIDAVIAETMDITQTIAASVSEQGQRQPDDFDDTVELPETTISKEVASIAERSGAVAQNATKMALGVTELLQANLEISEKADEVARSTNEMSSVMMNISQATQEIAKGTQDISQSMQETDKAITDTAAKASKVSECAHDVGEMANCLEKVVSEFKV
ncbi:MAG: methyl-accepting chemotaxis protein [Pelosinus sp.]|nr:methyl-accepting chemotaxis protein [Pelosinus sp.]